ncbi:MAG: ISNCY family transposase, partial [Candidatus Electrothrix sp. GM3_4]|nr:ISNCY family transposase [Candidatus Electrothrix sp. GM3_4]
VRSVLSVRKTFFNDLKALTKYLYFSGWSQLINFMFEQLEIKPISTG